MRFCVIGLGRFGYQLATVLAENGMEVVAIDSNESIVSSIRDQVTQAICMRITDESSLRGIGVDEIETVIVATGENFAQSILITALLKKRLQIPKVIARAINDIHQDILKLVGADRTILPEKEIGIRLAHNLSSPFTDLTQITKNFLISQIIAPQKFVGHDIASLDLYKNYKVHCIGIKQNDEKVISIDPAYIVKEKDRLLFSGHKSDLEKLTKL